MTEHTTILYALIGLLLLWNFAQEYQMFKWRRSVADFIEQTIKRVDFHSKSIKNIVAEINKIIKNIKQ